MGSRKSLVNCMYLRQAFNQLLGESGVGFVGIGKVMRRVKGGFPGCLSGVPMLLPTENTAMRRDLEYWFESDRLRPQVVGEFEDYALLRAFAQSGTAVFPVPSVFIRELRRQDKIVQLGVTEDVRLRYYAISAERNLKHPAVLAICESARHYFFQ